jgi:hypothetical protein
VAGPAGGRRRSWHRALGLRPAPPAGGRVKRA